MHKGKKKKKKLIPRIGTDYVQKVDTFAEKELHDGSFFFSILLKYHPKSVLGFFPTGP